MMKGVLNGLRDVCLYRRRRWGHEGDSASGRLRTGRGRRLLAGGLGFALAGSLGLHATVAGALPVADHAWVSYLDPSVTFINGSEWVSRQEVHALNSTASIPVNGQSAFLSSSMGSLGVAYRSPSATESVVFASQIQTFDVLTAQGWANPTYPHFIGVATCPALVLGNLDLGSITVKPSSTFPVGFNFSAAGVQSPAVLTSDWVGSASPAVPVVGSADLEFHSAVSWLAVAVRRPDGRYDWTEGAVISVDGGHRGTFLLKRKKTSIAGSAIDGGYRQISAAAAAANIVRGTGVEGEVSGDTITNGAISHDLVVGNKVMYVDQTTASGLASAIDGLDESTVKARIDADRGETSSTIPDPSLAATDSPAADDASWTTPRGILNNLWSRITAAVGTLGDILWPLRLIEEAGAGA